MIVDKIVIVIPEIKETTVLAMLSAIQAYERNAFEKHAAFYRTHIGQGNLELKLIIVRRSKYARFDFLWTKCLLHLSAIHNSLEEFDIEDLTSVIVLDEIVARSIAKTSRKHIAQTFGIILGSEAIALPLVNNLAPEKYEMQKDLVMIASPIPSSIEFPFPTTGWAGDDLDSYSLEWRAARCFECAAYAGQMSFESYLMSALRKPVFEISSKEDLALLSKWSSQNYIHSSSADSDAIQKGVSICQSRLASGK